MWERSVSKQMSLIYEGRNSAHSHDIWWLSVSGLQLDITAFLDPSELAEGSFSLRFGLAYSGGDTKASRKGNVLASCIPRSDCEVFPTSSSNTVGGEHAYLKLESRDKLGSSCTEKQKRTTVPLSNGTGQFFVNVYQIELFQEDYKYVQMTIRPQRLL